MSEDNNECEEYGEYDYMQEQYDYQLDLTYQKTLSKDKPYTVFTIQEIIRKLKDQIKLKQQLCCLPYGWTLMLYYLTDFSSDYFNAVLDQQQTGRKMIKYVEDYKVEPVVGQCNVCCEETNLYNNVCGHRFCLNCWKYHMQTHHNDRNNYQLFPMCQEQNCYHRTNYYLMEYLWKQVAELQHSFNKLLCVKYSQKSLNVRVCPQQKCSMVIYINDSATSQPIICSCQTNLCKHCGGNNHYPLECFDMNYWNDLTDNKQNQWLNALVIQRCPMCKTIIQKNDGCIHMTCVCKYQFCWICMKVWKNHNNFYKCAQTTREEHEAKLNLQKQKRKKDQNIYNQRYEQAKSSVQRLEKLFNKRSNFKQQRRQLFKKKLFLFKILQNDANIFNQLVDFTKEAWLFQKHWTIYAFFEKQNHKNLKSIIKVLSKVGDEIDDFVEEFDKMIDTIDDKNESQKQWQKTNAYFFSKKQRYYPLLKEALSLLNKLKKGQIDNLKKDIRQSIFLPKIQIQKQQSPQKQSIKEYVSQSFESNSNIIDPNQYIDESSYLQRLRQMQAQWNAQP